MADDKTAPAPILRKRQQIEKVGKNMFLWVAGASVILGICSVLALSLFERITYKQSVVNAKNETVGTLEDNIKAADALKDEVRVLNTNQALLDTPRLESTEPVSVILDALPSKANSSALGASLQQNLLNVDGVAIESLSVDSIAGVEDSLDDSQVSAAEENQITFQFSVNVDGSRVTALQDMLRRLERSIRTIDIVSVTIERQGSRVKLSANGVAYYQPEKKVELQEKPVPKGGN